MELLRFLFVATVVLVLFSYSDVKEKKKPEQMPWKEILNDTIKKDSSGTKKINSPRPDSGLS